MPQYHEDIKVRLRQALGAKNDRQLAGLLGRTTGAISGWRKRGSIPTHALDLASALTRKSVQWFLTGSEERSRLPRHAAILVREAHVVYHSLLDDLPADRRLLQAVRDLIEALKGPDQQAVELVLGNITALAERARGKSRKRRRREAG